MAATALLSSTAPMALSPYQDDPEEAQRKAAEKERIRAERAYEEMRTIALNLEGIAKERVDQRRPREEQWILDLEQYWGRYPAETMKALMEGNKSKLNINETRQKTDALAASLQDLLLPNDDRNWGIGPTPVPTLTEDASKATAAAERLVAMAKEAAEGANTDAEIAAAKQIEAQRDAAQKKADELNGQVIEGRKRASLMEMEMDDQLKESNYNAICRDVIEDACKLGTGIAKGPVTGDRVRKGWKSTQVRDPQTNEMRTEHRLVMSDGVEQPAMRHVSIWSYFPDMDVRTPSEGMGDMERHLLNRKGLRALADLPGFDKDAIGRLLLNKDGRASLPAYMADLRNLAASTEYGRTNIAGGSTGMVSTGTKLYHVWEYTGPLDPDDMEKLAEAIKDPDERASMRADIDERDPLAQLNAIVWFCEGEVLKFALYPYESGESMYSVYNLCKDEYSVFGYGVPYLIRDPQAGLNAAVRAMFDNMGLGTGPQIVVDRGSIVPADGNWEMTPRKIWWTKKDASAIGKDKRPFETFDINMHMAEIAAVIELMKKFIDEMAGVPALAQGEQGSGVTKTAQGMAILVNASNVVRRRQVKNFDDDFTVPTLRRWYDWNMQFSKKEHIKGDYSVDARGSSVLLAREMQATNLTAIIDRFASHPVFGPMLKAAPLLRKLFQAMMIPTEEVVFTDDEIKTAQDAIAKAQQQPPPEDPNAALDREKEIALAEMERDTRIELATLARDTQMMKMAETMNVTVDKIAADLEKVRLTLASKERLFAGEVAVERTMGSGGGSGGFVSALKGAPPQQPGAPAPA